MNKALTGKILTIQSVGLLIILDKERLIPCRYIVGNTTAITSGVMLICAIQKVRQRTTAVDKPLVFSLWIDMLPRSIQFKWNMTDKWNTQTHPGWQIGVNAPCLLSFGIFHPETEAAYSETALQTQFPRHSGKHIAAD